MNTIDTLIFGEKLTNLSLTFTKNTLYSLNSNLGNLSLISLEAKDVVETLNNQQK
jgi:hypothetical protein